MTSEQYRFFTPTIIFCGAGLIGPAITAIGLLGLQMLLTKLGIECSTAVTIIWWLTTITCLTLPILFDRYIANLYKEKLQSFYIKLTLFNLFEYISIQSTLAIFFTDGQTLCYVTDGQNGLELVLTAWIALPILILLSFKFAQTLTDRQKSQ
jgi:hypothetical protein